MGLMTRQEAADYLRLSLRKLDDLTASGDIRRVKIGERQRARVLFREVDLQTFVEANLSPDNSTIQRKALEVLKK